MNKNNSKDLTIGSPAKLIFYFALPIFLGSLFQQFYNLVDTTIVGHTLGSDALAAIGATAPIYGLIVGMAVGINNGFSIIVARYFGAKDITKMKNSIAMILILNFIISILFTFAGVITIKSLLEYLNTPQDIMESSYGYIVTIFYGMIITITYNMEAGILRAIGDSKTPLKYLVYSSIINIVLDIVFIVNFNLGLKGAAFATLISQFVSVVLCFNHIIKRCPELKLCKENFKLDFNLLKDLFITGLSMGFMLSIVSIGSVALQSSINNFGKDIITAHMAARKISEITMMPLGTLTTASATFVSQNYGANKLDRIKDGIKKTFLMGAVWSSFVVIVCYLFGGYIIKALTGNNQAIIIDTAVKYLKINTPFYYILAVLLVLRTSLQSIGRNFTPLISSSIELIGKFVVVGYLAPALGYFGVCICEPIIWILCAIFVTVVFFGDKKFKIDKNQSFEQENIV